MYIGIDLVNEPVTCGPDGLNNGKPAIPVDVLKKYYVDAYNLIRKVDQNGWVVFDTPYGPYPGADPINWWQFMTEAPYVRTMNDYHYYQLYTSSQVRVRTAAAVGVGCNGKCARRWSSADYCCSVSRCVATRRIVLQHIARCNMSGYVATGGRDDGPARE
jgi:hypothetical protein